MSMERFKEIVEAAKQQELEIEGQKKLIESLEKKLEGTIKKYELLVKAKTSHDTLIVSNNMKEFPDRKVEGGLLKHGLGFYGLTHHIRGGEGNITVALNYKHPITGRKTSMSRTRHNIVDALICRNEMAATLLKDGLIDLEKFLRIIRG